MDAFLIEGGRGLKGRVEISGSKNASLPCIFASLLTDEPLRLDRVPELRDTKTALELLSALGKRPRRAGGGVLLERDPEFAMSLGRVMAPYELVKQMRASVLAAGPLLARWGRARVALPGGCAIGTRPINIHLEGFRALGARVISRAGEVVMQAPARGLHSARIKLPFPSVGATENILMAAAAVNGQTILDNAAREPEIADLLDLLERMGAEVRGKGSSRLIVKGNKGLVGGRHSIIPDRIETGTFILFSCCCPGSEVEINNCTPEHNEALLEICRKSGVSVSVGSKSLRIMTHRNFRPRPISLATKVYPGFATDLQPLFMAFMSRCRGKSIIRETIFENRFMHAGEMGRMGAMISVSGDTAALTGTGRLTGAKVMASDLRAGAGLIAMALSAKGKSAISRIYHVDRGYEKLEQKLAGLGGKVKRFVEVRYKKLF